MTPPELAAALAEALKAGPVLFRDGFVGKFYTLVTTVGEVRPADGGAAVPVARLEDDRLIKLTKVSPDQFVRAVPLTPRPE